MRYKVTECETCRWIGKSFIGPRGNAGAAKLFVCAEAPAKRDHQLGSLLAGDAGDFLEQALRGFADPADLYITAGVKCFPDRDKVIHPVAMRCRKVFLDEELASYRGDKLLAVGSWATKLLTGFEHKEVRGKVVTDQLNRRIGCIFHPAYFIRMHVVWEQNDRGKYRPKAGTMERARAEFLAHAAPVIEELFSGGAAGINLNARPEFPFTQVASVDRMCDILHYHISKQMFFDLETTGLDWFKGPGHVDPLITAFSFFQNRQEIGYTPGSRQLTYARDKVVVYTGPWTERLARLAARTKAMAFNAVYDTGVVLKHTGVGIPIFADPMLAAYVANQARKKYPLESLAYEYVPELATYGLEMKKLRAKIKEILAQDPAKVAAYVAGDAVVPMIMWYKLLDQIAENGQEFLLWEIMFGGVTVLRDMEARGLYLNRPLLETVQQDLTEKLTDLIDRMDGSKEAVFVRRVLGKEFNPKSGDQLHAIYRQFWPGKQFPNLEKATLKQHFAETNDPFTGLLLAYKPLQKQHSTYVRGLEEKAHEGCAYPSFRMISTVTGRTSSGGSDAVGLGKTSQINIQNIPRGATLRKLFRARPGHYLLAADYSQIEVRVAAAYAQEPALIDAFTTGKDIHASVAAAVYGMTYDDVVAEDEAIKKTGGTSKRTEAKVTTFGLLYGRGALGLAQALGWRLPNGEFDIERAERFIETYFSGMPRVHQFILKTQEFIRHNKFAKTPTGRIRQFSVADDEAMRQGVNFMIQSVASDIFILSLRTLKGALERAGLYNYRVFPWAEVHDSVTFEIQDVVPEEQMQAIMTRAMVHGVRAENTLVHNFLDAVPLEVDFKSGVEWA